MVTAGRYCQHVQHAAADPSRRRLLGLVGAVAVSALTLAGCSAGQDAQTVEQTSVVDGTAFEAGAVNLRDVGLRAPIGNSYSKGANAYLEGLVVNTASSGDQLVSVSTPLATSVAFYADGVTALLGTAATPSATASASSSATVSTSPTDTGAPTQGGTPTSSVEATETGSASVSPSATTSAAAAPDALQRIDLATDQAVQFGYGNNQPAIVLLGLTQAIFPAQAFPITFTFASGASVTANVTVKLPVGRTLEAPTINTEEGEGGE